MPEVLGVVSRSIARGSRRTAPTPGLRVNGAVLRHATLGKRRVVWQVHPPEHQALGSRDSLLHHRHRVFGRELEHPGGARALMDGPAHALPLVGVCGRERRAGAGDQRPWRARIVAQALAQGLRNLLESGQAEIGEARVLAGQARAFGRLATVAPRSSRLATVAPRSSSYGDRRGPREVFLIISVATARSQMPG
jgi:hypothetical protein